MNMIKPFKPKEECDDAIRQSECIDVLRRSKFLHLGMFHANDPADPDAVKYPYVVPMTFGFDCKDDKPLIYMHLGYRPDNPRLKAIKNNPHVFFAVEADVQVLPIPSNPCMSTVRYLGVEGRGVIELLCHSTPKHKEEVQYALDVIMRQMTGQMADGKYLKWNFDPELLKFLVILKLTINAYKNTSHLYDFKPVPWYPPKECQDKKE